MPPDLNRFVTAQDHDGTHVTALAELRAGRKRSHWMWFVLPQLAGLGHSAMAQRYGIAGLDEARAYLAHPVLGPRLMECVRALTALPDDDPVAVLGGIDAQKLRSSMTLFARAADSADPADPTGSEEARDAFTAVLDQYFDGVQDEETVRRLGA
ncbi:DUF1810 domain-containing protein [Cellulomonas sp. ATA003]|uniref:DUF1810 domain-containing protein n=1 Tax=Cellulomonas sp. ATA003 TaxID=3073064 RepID=UPI0028734EFB|nr:DUF1810 domain-containing protein [Cellulomonas sp. ATA003]WNB84600.1 DUF1810 domain-containing protein [Cellulomonas sp. ATA003]